MSRHGFESWVAEKEVGWSGFFIRIGIDIGCLASKASRMDSTMLSILAITTAAVLETLVPSIVESTVESIDDEGEVGGNGGWRLGKDRIY